ncbi:unnamed protein product [Urochloa humidicola]
MPSGASTAKVKKGEVDVDELLKKLRLSDAEREGVVLAKEERGSLPEVKWMAAAKLLIGKKFSEQSLMSTMWAAWNTAREVSFRSVGKNLFVVQAFCLGDWKRIMEDGPWIFRGCALMLEEFDGSTSVPTAVPNKVLAWVQVHMIPPLYRTESILKQLAGKIGEVVGVEMKAIPTSSGDFYRARVKLDASKPLARFVTLSPEGSVNITLRVKYKKLPRFCFFCGQMGHSHLECGTGEHAEEDLQFGDWMISNEEFWHPSTPRVRGFNLERGGGRGGSSSDRGGRAPRGGSYDRGTGRGGSKVNVWREKGTPASESSGSKKQHPEEAGLDDGTDLEDTAISPNKTEVEKSMQAVESNAKKQLVMISEAQGAAAALGVPPPPPKYVSPREQKKQKKSKADSREEDRRVQ